jgi:hypothetical protein
LRPQPSAGKDDFDQTKGKGSVIFMADLYHPFGLGFA